MNLKKSMDESSEIKRTNPVWYALRTFRCKELEVESYLKEKGYSPFVPMFYQNHVSLDGTCSRELAPAVHNLLFLRKEEDTARLARVLSACPVPVVVLTHPHSPKYYEIPDAQMTEFRAICDPDYTGTLYTDRDFAEARPGQPVRVIRGTFTGLTGKLVRYKNRSYVVITLATVGVFVHIPKWYCEKLL